MQYKVTLKLFDIKGRVLKTLVDEVKKAGEYYIDFKCNNMSNGTYFVHLRAGERAVTKKITIIK